MSADRKRNPLLKEMYEAILGDNVDGVNRCLISGANPAESVHPFIRSISRASRRVKQGIYVQDRSEIDTPAKFPFIHFAVSRCDLYPSGNSLEIVREMLDLFPEAIHATAQGMMVVPFGQGQFPIPFGNGLNVLHFFNQVKTFATSLAMPGEVEAMLANVSQKWESMHRFPHKLLEQLHSQDNDDSLVDLHMLCSDGVTTIAAHKTIMSVASPYFRSLFGEHWKDVENGIWKSEASSVVLKAIKKYIYIGDFSAHEFSELQLQELFVASHQYNLLDIFHRCEKWLIRRLSLENFATVLVLSSERETDAADLYAACVQFFQTHSTDLHFDPLFHKMKTERSDVWSSLEASLRAGRTSSTGRDECTRGVAG